MANTMFMLPSRIISAGTANDRRVVPVALACTTGTRASSACSATAIASSTSATLRRTSGDVAPARLAASAEVEPGPREQKRVEILFEAAVEIRRRGWADGDAAGSEELPEDQSTRRD